MEEMTSLPLPQKQLPEGGRYSPILLLASLFLILISLSTSAYLYLQNQRLSSQLITPSPTSSPTSAPVLPNQELSPSLTSTSSASPTPREATSSAKFEVN